MSDSCIEKSIDAVKKYLDEVDKKNKLNGEFDKYYSEKVKDIKVCDLSKEKWYMRLSKKVKGILDGSKLYNYNIKEEYENVFWKAKRGDFVVGYKGYFNIEYPSILAQLCEIYGVQIDSEFYAKLGNDLDDKFNISASAVIYNERLTLDENTKMEKEWQDKNGVALGLEEKCKCLLTELRKKIAEKHKDKFDFFESSPDNIENWKWDDNAVYDLVSQLDEFKSNVKSMFSDKFKKNNKADDFDAELKRPAPDLLNLLKDEKLETYINEYKKKSLEERKKDPLRQVFRLNGGTSNRKLDDIVQKQTIQQWFMDLMKGTPDKNRKDIYFILLELFGKDFEFGGGYNGQIPKAKLWDRVDKKAVKAWYKKNKIKTDLFDDLQTEKKEKIVIIEEQNDNNINATAKKNKSLIKNENFNMDISNKSKKERGAEKKQSKTSKTGYKLGLGLDILVTILFVYLGISNPLFFLALIITVPTGIYCGIKLSGCCLSFDDEEIVSPYDATKKNYLFSEIDKPEHQPNQYNIIDNEDKDPNNEKLVKIIEKCDQ